MATDMTTFKKTPSKTPQYWLTLLGGIASLFFAASSIFSYIIISKYTLEDNNAYISLFFSAAIILLVLLYVMLLAKTIFIPLKQLRGYIVQCALGNVDVEKYEISNQEIDEVATYVAKLSQSNLKTAAFAKEIGKGNFNSDYTPSDQDVLGHALLEMRGNMLTLAENEKNRSWINEGMAKFGEILRSNTQDINTFSDHILTPLVKYVGANQGMFYVIHEDQKGETYLELTACYAWGRKKHLDSRVEIGEGLIGQAVVEKEMIFLTDIPDNFIHITSGLGDASPNAVIVLPLIYNEEVFGVIEIASFYVYKDFQREFLQKICIGIASSIANVRVNARTNKLLNESIEQSKELQEKDGTMRQQMEELRATQEEMERKELQKRQMESKTNSILEGCVESIVAFNQEGKIEFFNKAAQDIWHISREDALGMNISKLLPIEIPGLQMGSITTTGNGSRAIMGKNELTIQDLKGGDLEILCSISKTLIDNEYFFTAFIQNMTVDIF